MTSIESVHQFPDTSPTPEVTVSRTRSGRVSKPPQRYTPQEICEDDYESDDYDSDESGSFEESCVDTDEFSSESDADEDGNLAGFVVEDKSSSDNDSNGSDVQSDTSETDIPDRRAVTGSTTKRGGGGGKTLVL